MVEATSLPLDATEDRSLGLVNKESWTVGNKVERDYYAKDFSRKRLPALCSLKEDLSLTHTS